MSQLATQSTAVAVAPPKPKTIRDHLASDDFKKQVALALPKHVTPERFTRVALTALNRTPKLADCTQQSLFQCLLDLSALGLEPDNRRAYLLPYGDKCTLIVGYQGKVDLVMRSGDVSNIHADVVCENDEFEYDLGEIKKHKIDFREERGAMYAAYCIVTMKDGTKRAEVMSKADVDAIRKRSRSANNGPWVTDFNEMAKKTVFHRCSKWLPMSSELREKLEKDDDYEPKIEIAKPIFGGDVIGGEATDAPVEVVLPANDELTKKIAEAGIEEADFVMWAIGQKHVPDTVNGIAQIPAAKAKMFVENFDKVAKAVKGGAS